jgi:hypothetical protein
VTRRERCVAGMVETASDIRKHVDKGQVLPALQKLLAAPVGMCSEDTRRTLAIDLAGHEPMVPACVCVCVCNRLYAASVRVCVQVV